MYIDEMVHFDDREICQTQSFFTILCLIPDAYNFTISIVRLSLFEGNVGARRSTVLGGWGMV